jgi:hypothetical protein
MSRLRLGNSISTQHIPISTLRLMRRDIRMPRVHTSGLRRFLVHDLVFIAAPLAATALWLSSLSSVHIGRMSDLGLVSVLPPAAFVALAMLMVSFCFALREPTQRTLIILLHIGLLVFMLYGVTALVEAMPRFNVNYRDAGFTEYITRTGTLAPGLDAYFNWPGFFIFSAVLVKTMGVASILSFAAWSSFVLNLLYVGPLHSIYSSFTSDKRLIWLGIWIFVLSNWIGQDYYAPQGFDFFLYLVIIAIMLRWLKGQLPAALNNLSTPTERRAGAVRRIFAWLTQPEAPQTPISARQKILMLICLLAIFGVIVCSHPLTPFFTLLSVTGLVVLRGYRPRWLPVILALMTVAWIGFMTRVYLVGHLAAVLGEVGNVQGTVTANVTGRIVGSPEHIFITVARVAMTALIWLLACGGFVRRLRHNRQDATPVALALAPLLMAVAQSYGGEIFLRIYLFALPPIAFFAAALLFPTLAALGSRWRTIAAIGLSFVLLSGFVFTRYGNERNDYMSVDEVTGMRQLYRLASPGALFVDVDDGAPWQFQQIEQFEYLTLMDTLPQDLAPPNIGALAEFIKNHTDHPAYLIITRSQAATLESTSGLPSNALNKFERAILTSGYFTLVYSNPDAQIYRFVAQPAR